MAIAISLLGSGTTGGSPTSAGTSTSGARLAVCVSWDAGQTITSVVDSKGNSYSAVGTAQADGNGGLLQWYFSAGGSTGSSHTATVSFSGSAFPVFSLYQITDGASVAHSGSAQGQDTGGQPFVLTSGTMPSGNWGALAACSNNTGSDGAYTANASTPTFTLLFSEGTVSADWTQGVSATTSSGTGAVTPSFNRSGTSGGTTGMAILVVEESTGGGGPNITSTSSATPAPGSSLTITGTAFQASQGAGFVTLGGVTQTVTSWADTSITITVVRGTAKYGSQNIVVRDNGGTDSSGYGVTLTPPTGFAYVDLASVNSTAAWRIVTVPDLAIGDQISYPTAGGLVVANDATFFWTYGSLRSFDSEVWTSADGWGAVFTQYLAPAFSIPPQPPSQIPRIQRRWPRVAPDPFDIVGSKTGVEKWFAWELTVAAGGSGVALTGVSATGAVGSFGVAASTALSGNAATGAVGSFGVTASTVLSGNAATGSVGSFGVSTSNALSGIAATTSVGSFGVTVSVALSGNSATGAVGTLTPSLGINVALTGVEGTGGVGAFGVAASVALSGNAATGAVGDLTPAAAGSVALTGNAATGAVGNLAPAVSVSLSGVSATVAVGSVTAAALAALSGNGATGAVGSFQAFLEVALSGVVGTGGVGNLSPAGGSVSVDLTGVQGTGAVGDLLPGGGEGNLPGGGSGGYASTIVARRRQAELDQQLTRQRQAEAAAAEAVAERERALVRAKSEATKARERTRLAKAQAQQAEQSRLADLIAQELAALMAEDLRTSALTRDAEEEEALLLLLLA